MPQVPVIGNIAEDYYIGGTHVIICDDAYRDITESEINDILDRINLIGVRIIMANQSKGRVP